MEALTERQQVILDRLIDAHIESAQPIGSRLITERYQLNYSPATVRHEMGALEEVGYLTHPHTSSGRLPTDQGYRYYVDHCLQQESISGDLFEPLAGNLKEAGDGMEFLGERVPRVLSAISKEVGLVLVPQTVAEDRDQASRNKLFLQGSTQLLRKPEFQDVEKVCHLFQAFEEKAMLVKWLLQNTPEEGVSVTIGQENTSEALKDCSVISTSYGAGEEHRGTISIIGPRRMRYSRMVMLVREMAYWVDGMIEKKESE